MSDGGNVDENNFARAVGARIARLRKMRNWNQEQLGEAVGQSRAHLGHIEVGRTKVSGFDLLRISQALGVSVDELLGPLVVIRHPMTLNLFYRLECAECGGSVEFDNRPEALRAMSTHVTQHHPDS